MSASAPLLSDPFGPVASVNAYVPYAACERALEALERVLERRGWIGALVGPPGLGKTLLLHRLAERAGDRLRAAYLPFCSLSLEELCAFALGLLELEAGEDPVATLSTLARERAAAGSGLLLLVDDVGALPEQTAREIAALVAQLGGALRVVVAAVDSAESRCVFEALGDRLEPVQLTEGMSEGETRRYVETRLSLAGASGEVRAVFDEPAIELLHRESEGVPRRLNLVAQARLRGVLDEEPVPKIGAPPLPPAAPPEGPGSVGPDDAIVSDAAVIDSLVEAAAAPRPPAPARPAARRAEERRPTVDRDELLRLGAYRYAKGQVEGAAEANTSAPPAAREPEREAAFEEAKNVDRTMALLVERGPAPAAEPEPAAPESSDPSPAVSSPALAARRSPGPLLAIAALVFAFVAGLYVTLSRDLTPLAPIEPEPPVVTSPETALEPEAPIVTPLETALEPEAPAPTVPEMAPVEEIVAEPEALPSEAEPELAAAEPSTPVVPPAVAVEPTPELAEPAAESMPPTWNPVAAPEPTLVTPEPPALEPGAPAPEAPTAAPALAPAPTFPVSINATPWAVVEVDGRELGETPIAGVELEAGTHRFRARMPDGSVREQIVEIDADSRFVVFE